MNNPSEPIEHRKRATAERDQARVSGKERFEIRLQDFPSVEESITSVGALPATGGTHAPLM